MRNSTVTLALMVAFALFATAVHAATTQRDSERVDGSYILQYRWQDFNGEALGITLRLPVTTVHNSFRKYRAYQPERANRELRYKLTRYARRQGWNNMEVLLRQRETVLEIRQRGNTNTDAMAKMETAHEAFFTEYLRENFYNRHTDATGRTGIKPDHVAIAEASAEIIDPMAEAFGKLLGDNTQREYLGSVLSFMQGIPYQELTDRIRSNGAGFNPPARILLEHQADCDSKVTLMGGLLRELMPDVPVYAVYVPEHAFLALRMSRRDDEATIEIDGQSYLVVEPTGPASLKIGELSEASARYVAANQYRTERFP